jgi:hypothetical protein
VPGQTCPVDLRLTNARAGDDRANPTNSRSQNGNFAQHEQSVCTAVARPVWTRVPFVQSTALSATATRVTSSSASVVLGSVK